MIKRKMGIKAVATMVIVLIMIIISELPVYASDLNEVTIFDDFVVQVENVSDKDYEVTIKLIYQDENEDTLNTKNVTKTIGAFETIEIDAKAYYNSKKTQKVLAEIVNEEKFEQAKYAKYCFIIAVILFILFMILGFVQNFVDSDPLEAITRILLGCAIVVFVIGCFLKLVALN